MIPSNLNDPMILLRGIKGQQHREAVTAGLGLTSCYRSPVYDITGRAPECREQLGPPGAARSRALGSTGAGSPGVAAAAEPPVRGRSRGVRERMGYWSSLAAPTGLRLLGATPAGCQGNPGSPPGIWALPGPPSGTGTSGRRWGGSGCATDAGAEAIPGTRTGTDRPG